jgi:hypothetical protein
MTNVQLNYTDDNETAISVCIDMIEDSIKVFDAGDTSDMAGYLCDWKLAPEDIEWSGNAVRDYVEEIVEAMRG